MSFDEVYVSYCALEPSAILMDGAPFFSFESCAIQKRAILHVAVRDKLNK